VGTKAVGVVGMQMRHQHDFDAVGSTPGGGVLQRASSRALGRLEGRNPVAAVDEDCLLPVLISSGLNGTVTILFGT
jgi:hypothetical protein